MVPAADIGTRFISLDCFIDSRNEDRTGENGLPLVFARLIIFVSLPIVLIVVSAIFWYIRYFFEIKGLNRRENYYQIREAGGRRDSKITTTNIVILFMIHPSVVKGMFSMFLCDDVDGKNRLVKDLEVECYTGIHLYFVLFLTIPGILAWGFGIPFGAVRLLKHYKDELYTDKVKKELGFLYTGYKYSAYYWEEVIMIRKMIIIFVATFISTQGKIYQTLVVQIIVAMFLAAHCAKKPFQDASLNWLEGLSLGATFITMYAGYFFLAGVKEGESSTTSNNDFELTTWMEWIFFLLILGFQAAFLLVWIWQLHIEIKRLIRDKSPKWYKKIYLRKKSAKVMEQSTIDLFVQKEKAMESYIEILDQIQNDIQYLWAEKDSGALINPKEFEYALVLAHQKFKKHETFWKSKNNMDEMKDTLVKKGTTMTKEEKALHMRMKQLSQLEETKEKLKVDFELPLSLKGAFSAPIKMTKDKEAKDKELKKSRLDSLKGSVPKVAFLSNKRKFRRNKKKQSTVLTAEPEKKLRDLLNKFMDPMSKVDEHKEEESSALESEEEEEDKESQSEKDWKNKKNKTSKIDSPIKTRGFVNLLSKDKILKESGTPEMVTNNFFKDTNTSKIDLDIIEEQQRNSSEEEEEKLDLPVAKKDLSLPIDKTNEFEDVLNPIELDTDRLYGKIQDGTRNDTVHNVFNDSHQDATIDEVKEDGFKSDEEEQQDTN